MHVNRTQKAVSNTQQFKTRHSALTVLNKDPNYDYCFRPRKDIEDGGGVDMYGYAPVGTGNESGEEWGGLPGMAGRTKGAQQKRYLDTILCRRPKEVSAYFKRMEDDKYNSQVKFIRDTAKNARMALRALDEDAVVRDESEFTGRPFTQRTGPTDAPMLEKTYGAQGKKVIKSEE